TCGSEPSSDTIPRVRHSRLRLERMDSSPIRAGDSSLRQPPLKKALGHAAEWMALLAIPPVTWTLGTVGDHTWMTNSALRLLMSGYATIRPIESTPGKIGVMWLW